MNYKIKTALLFMELTIYNLSVVAFSWCFKLVTDSLVEKDFRKFVFYITVTIVVVCVQVVSNYLYITGKNRFVKIHILDKKSRFIYSIFNSDIASFYNREIAEYQSFLFNDFAIYEQKVVVGRIELCEKIILLVMAALSIVIINFRFLTLVAVIAILSICIPFLMGKKIKKCNVELSANNSNAMDKIDEMLKGFLVLRAFSVEKIGVDECEQAVDQLETTKEDCKNIMALFQSLLLFMTTIMTLIVFIWGGKAVLKEDISVGELITLIQLLFNISAPLMGIMTVASNIRAASPIVEKYHRIILDTHPSGSKDIKEINSIELKDLNLRYEDDKSILNNISYVFDKNKKYAIVGENGSGKSTLLKIIAGVIGRREYEGSVTYNGVNRYDVNEKEFWSSVSYIPQQAYLFKKTLSRNIFLNSSNDDLKEYKALEQRLAVDELIEGEAVEAQNLSGGEKQKIVFIREMMKKADVILADEPDSALDPDSAVELQNVLLAQNSMCIVVTHRIGRCLEKYDEIIVMNEGKIAEHGSYEKLVEQRGLFYSMLNAN